jgi:flavin reductase (DIM6/NTAB) family NADH-FMN oxidoreductase RutF
MSTSSSSVSSLDKEAVGRAIGRIPSGVHVVTLERNGEKDGMLTSWISQAAFEPPMLSVAVKKERAILSSLAPNSSFVVNVLSKSNMDVYKNFAKPYTAELDRYEGLNVDVDSNGNPILIDAVAYLSCTVRSHAEAGDHVLILAEINNGAPLQIEHEPMVHLRKNGFQY